MTDEQRAALERRFQHYIALDVSPLVLDDPAGAEAVSRSLSARLLHEFDPRWPAVVPNYGGTMGHHAAYVQAKTAAVAATLTGASGAERLQEKCAAQLQAFWQEWAGYHLTET